MEQRIARFIAGLRASGVRISVAESQDAWRAVKQMGITEREEFRLSLRASLIKDHNDFYIFDELFPMYFGNTAPPILNPEAELTPEQQQMLQDFIRDMALDMQTLLDWLLRGQTPSQQEMDELMEQSGAQYAMRPGQADYYSRRMQQLLNWDRLDDVLDQLWEYLAEQGMSPQEIDQLRRQVEQNRDTVGQQLDDMVGEQIQDNMIEDYQRRQDNAYDLMERSFDSLSETEADVLRDQVRRLAARLRSRAALRQKRGREGKLDAKGTIRASLRYGGVPFEMKMKVKRTKPKVVVIMDVSQSMRHVVEFFLRLTYELDDQIQKMTTFAFYERLENVTSVMGSSGDISAAVREIYTLFPYKPYGTDLGKGLGTLIDDHLSEIDHRTTVIVVGDGRNNYNDPNLEAFGDIQRRARKIIWMNPEYPAQWGSGDSDMKKYEPLCSEVHQVRNLKQLSEAIDAMLS